MDKFVKLGQDMVLLWSKYKVMYWAGIWNTLKLAFLATLKIRWISSCGNRKKKENLSGYLHGVKDVRDGTSSVL